MGGKPAVYDQNYIRQCFDIWYLNGRPTSPTKLKDLYPIHEPSGRKPSVKQINRWIIEGAWDMWADDLDAKAMVKLDNTLVNKKVAMLRLHQKNAEKVAKKALKYIDDKGFDSSASAVQAIKWAQEEQRKTEGFSDLLERLENMTNNDVERAIIEKFNRIKENDQIVEVDAEDVEQELDESQE